ncbi:uncharacterized protein TRUGW13939_11060 [Talaromyces rugulosus]|uniref:Phosphotransferase enzyme family protein n=1 Tax=Talaromyces rugulosus TaxID=121627 RepID=A0A7H8RD16_TALRU|nr:uncharacterized protein TRUGW13939_11060 [Talaromyces rugulosus]QKX63888.1 hypothetical protein TRUGW13939_11060 [Talaromyces rugulosus]
MNIIDWQFTLIMPAFMQAQWPSFITPPDDYEIGMVKPELPPNFDAMDSNEKSYALTERNRALLSKCYEAALAKNHLSSYLALTRVDSDLRQLFTYCENTTRDGIVPLRDYLIHISEKWSEMGFNESYPYLMTDDDLSKHELELSRYKDWQTLKGYTQELLQSDTDGWISPQLDFQKVSERHNELYKLYMEREIEELSEEDAKNLWYYVDES